MLQHISWENDSLKIVLPKHKGDQEGKFHRTPADFSFLSLNVKTLFDLWNFGDVNRRICPFRRLEQSDIPKKSDQKKLIKARRIMKEIERRAIVDDIWPNQRSIRSLGIPAANCIFQDGYEKLLTSIEEGKRRRNLRFNEYRRDNEIQYVTLYNDLKLVE
jgi:hypothetical protein